ncbi:MAG: cytochrome d ubiquinol oxidase subunit II [Blastocatellia bacterium]|nr:cytochrome d ubiquinol oxidase subunit II [Blastocatellia bacterium]
METGWYIILALMLTAYVIFDGFDFGAGIIHFLVAKNNEERSLILKSIGPVWDGNEVWLLAAGGSLYLAFPPLYAISFSGFYLPLMMVVWLLIFRACGIEFRMHLNNSLWQQFFDAVFSISSLLITIFLGAALGNVIRGVAIDKTGYFFAPLWTNFLTGGSPGIIDWYTLLTAILATIVLTTHGSLYVVLKTESEINLRTRKLIKILWPLQIILSIVCLAATFFIRPEILNNYKTYIWGWIFPLIVIASLIGIVFYLSKNKEFLAFLSSCAYIIGMLGGAAFALYPNLLPAIDPTASLTVYNSAASFYSLKVGFAWWIVGFLLVTVYFTYLYRHFAGKVTLDNANSTH